MPLPATSQPTLTSASPSTSSAACGRIRIGISGWRYSGWRGVFYPPGLQQRRELEFASSTFDTIEINGTFYSLQHLKGFLQWARETPPGFIFALKGSRYITHMLKLRDVEVPLANYFASGMLTLGPKFGPVLWQFAPQMRHDRDRFTAFIKLLPRTLKQAASLARRHATRLPDLSALQIPADAPIRHCFEIRDPSFAVPEFIDLLREQNIGLVVADTVEWPLLLDVTSDFVYCRLHGSEQLYTSGYSDTALDTWASRIAIWAAGGTPPPDPANQPPAIRAHPVIAASQPRDVFVYFDNDAKVRAPFDAQNLRTRVDRLMNP